LLQFFSSQRDVLSACIKDAVALAIDVQANAGLFSEKKYREYLKDIEPSIEKLKRNQVVTELRVRNLLGHLTGHAG